MIIYTKRRYKSYSIAWANRMQYKWEDVRNRFNSFKLFFDCIFQKKFSYWIWTEKYSTNIIKYDKGTD